MMTYGEVAMPDERGPISDRERRIVHLIIADHSDEQIAADLFVAVRTMQRQLRRLMDRVGAPNRCALGAIAAHHGWLAPEALGGPASAQDRAPTAPLAA